MSISGGVTDRTEAQEGRGSYAGYNKGGYVGLQRRTRHGLRTLHRTNHTKECEESNKDKATLGKSGAPLQSVQKFVAATSMFPAGTTIMAGKES